MPNIGEITVEIVDVDSNIPTMEFDLKVVTLGGVTDLQCKHCTRELGKPTWWCQHIATAASNRDDQKIFWGPEPGLSPCGDKQFEVIVPIVPTMGLMTRVIVTGGDMPIGKRYAVEWDHSPSVSGSVFICYLSPGEGRNAIRTTLLEHMLADPQRLRDCAAGHHGISAQQIWGRKVLESRGKSNVMLPEYWSIYTTQWCLYCSSHNPANDPSNIPTGDGSGGFPR